MALKVQYKIDPNAVSAKLYRTTGRRIFSSADYDDVINLDPSASEHIYSDVVNGLLYGFVIEVTDSDGKTDYSLPFNLVYKREKGPGPKSIQRGYPDFGVFGELTPEEFGISPEDLRLQLLNDGYPNMAANYLISEQGWYKCLVDGKIIFIPKNFHLYLGRVDSYNTVSYLLNSGMISQDSEGNYNFDNCPVVQVGTEQYRWRGLKHWLGKHKDIVPFLKSTTVPSYDDKTEAVLFLTLCNQTSIGFDPLLEGTSSNGNELPPFVAGDNNTLTMINANNVLGTLGNSNFPNTGGSSVLLLSNLKFAVSGSTSYGTKWIPVLELLE